MLNAPAQYQIEDLLGNFGDLASRLSGLEGQKHVVYLSTGFNAGKMQDRSTRILYEMYDSFRAAGVFLDSVDIAGMRSKWDNTTHMTKVGEMTVMDWLRSALRVNDSLALVARGTGGQFIHDENDLAKAITNLATVQQVVYILGFHRRGSRGGEIGMSVKGLPFGTRVSYRPGFGAAQRHNDVDPLQLADILINDVPQSGLTLALRADANEVEVAIPVDEVRAQLVEQTPFVDVLLYVFDDRGAAVEGMQKRIRFDSHATEGEGPIIVRKHVTLPRAHYIVKVIARIEGTTSLVFARTELTVK